MTTTDTIKIPAAILLLCLPFHLYADRSTGELVADRLSLMKSVAAYKWINQRPVEDLTREQTVIRAAVLQGLQYNMERQSIEQLFQAQINAAKDIQQCWMNRWLAGPPPRSAPDLNRDVRPGLLALGRRIMMSLARAGANPAISLPAVDCLSSDAADSLMKAADNIRFYSSPLNRIRQSGILRVGTTGDYLPFSYSDDGTDFRGIDIDLAHDLGESLGVEVLFVSTSWPTLTRDLSDNRYDIAMSGVSIIDSRKRFGHFSQPYHTGGKTPITRCEHLSRFDSLEKIDRPGVRLIVNPGGTNERFIDEQVNQAEKVLHPDNRTIFVALVDGKADLMITDSIEATLQANLHPALCRSMPSQTVTFQEKGYLMTKDDGLKTFVDDWLAESLETGELATIFATHLNR